MIKNIGIHSIKLVTASIMAFVCIVLMMVYGVGYAGAQDFNPIDLPCEGSASNSELCQETRSSDDPILSEDGVLQQVANILALVSGIIAVIIIVISGIRLITSSGDSNAVSTARNTIIYAAIGLVVIVFARIIVLYIAGELA